MITQEKLRGELAAFMRGPRSPARDIASMVQSQMESPPPPPSPWPSSPLEQRLGKVLTLVQSYGLRGGRGSKGYARLGKILLDNGVEPGPVPPEWLKP